MSVIIRLQNLPWSANALDIRNFFRGLSIPEGGVHIVGGELGDAFMAFSTDEDARQAMMLDGGKIKEIQVKLYLSSRSEMHKVIETARQSVPILSLAPVAPAVIPPPVAIVTAPAVSPFSPALGNSMANFGIPGIGNPQEIPQPAVIEAPMPITSPPMIITPEDDNEDSNDRKRYKEKDRRRSRSRSRSRDRKDRNKRDRRDRSRSRERRRRDRSRSRDRVRDRKRDRKDRSRSSERSQSRRSRDQRSNNERKSPPNPQEKLIENQTTDGLKAPPPPAFSNINLTHMIPMPSPILQNSSMNQTDVGQSRLNDPSVADTFNKLQELGKKRNPNAFQGEQQQNGSGRFQGGRGDGHLGRGGNSRRDGRVSRFDHEPQRDCCVSIRNAPTHTSYGDVRRFFPFMIDKHGIKMINDNTGRRTGNIFVRFCDPRSKQLALQRKVNELKGANVIVEDLDDEGYEAAVDSFLPFRQENDEEIQNIAMPEMEELPPQFNILKLTDLPNYVKEHDIIKTFSDFSLLSIMINDCRITRSKIAYVHFVKAEDASTALARKERYIFGKRHPTIMPMSVEEYEKVKTVQNERIPEPRVLENVSPVVEMEPPPQEPETVVPRDPRQRRQFDNGPTPHAPPQPQNTPFFPASFVQGQQFSAPFPNPQFGGFPGNALDPRTAAVKWANRPPFPNQTKQNMPVHVNQNSNDMDEESLDCVLMKGLPSDATDRTIVSFLSDTGAVPARIHLMLDGAGIPSGDCFCEFRAPQEARMAATKHGHDLDGCRITVDLVTRGVVEEALEGPKVQQPDMRDPLLGNVPLQKAPFPDGPRGGFQPRGSFRGRGGFDRGFDRGGGGYRGGYEGRGGGNFDTGRGNGGFDAGRGGFDSGRRNGGFDSGRGNPGFDSIRGGGFDSGRGGGFDSGRGGFDSGRGGFDSGRGGFDSGRGGFDSGRGSFRGRGGFNDRGRFDRGRGPSRGFGRGGRGGFENGREREFPVRDDAEQDPALEDFGAPGCVVSMENVPFRASVDDILSYFGDFELTQDDIIRRYNERGQPTGDARVAFRTPFDAQRAVKTRHMNTIHERRINLAIL